jgi:hypothetical protein
MPNTKTSSISGNPASLERHRRKCVICKHKDREDIETDFLHWHSAINIVCDYDLPQARALYRHVHATGLYAKRQQDMRYAAAHIVDNAENVKPTAHAVLQAMRACTLINDQGVWVDPPKHIVHTHIEQAAAQLTSSAAEAPASASTAAPTTDRALPVTAPSEPVATTSAADADSEPISNRHEMQLENAATQTNQKTEPRSNRHVFDPFWDPESAPTSGTADSVVLQRPPNNQHPQSPAGRRPN